MRKKIVAGNWKMNCNREEALSLVTEIKGMLNDEVTGNVEVVVAPPFVHIGAITRLLTGTGISVAAQNCADAPSGAFTGEVSAEMIRSTGATFVIIGHSERRAYFGETNATVAAKIHLALKNQLTPVICVGESLTSRESGDYFSVIEQQLTEGMFHLSSVEAERVVIAYEPVWAIGTGKTASPEQAQEVHYFIRHALTKKYHFDIAEKISILYGGSCNESNARDLFALPDVDGGLIGGASLKSRSFVNIIRSF